MVVTGTAVGVDAARPLPGPTVHTADLQDRVKQRQQPGDAAAMTTRQRHGERDTDSGPPTRR